MTEPQEVEILLVENNLDDAELTVQVLRRNNLANHIEVVRDGEEALDFLFCKGAFKERSFRPPRLVLLDLKLPKLDGLEVVRQIKGDPRTKVFPVLVIRHDRGDDLKFAWAQARLPGQPSGKEIIAAVAGLVQE